MCDCLLNAVLWEVSDQYCVHHNMILLEDIKQKKTEAKHTQSVPLCVMQVFSYNLFQKTCSEADLKDLCHLMWLGMALIVTAISKAEDTSITKQ